MTNAIKYGPWLTQEMGFGAPENSKSQGLNDRISEDYPEEFNIFFDNVRGAILDTDLASMAMHGHIVLCGGVSKYNDVGLPVSPRNYMLLIVKRCRVDGFIVFVYLHRAHEATRDLRTRMAGVASGVQRTFSKVSETHRKPSFACSKVRSSGSNSSRSLTRPFGNRLVSKTLTLSSSFVVSTMDDQDNFVETRGPNSWIFLNQSEQMNDVLPQIQAELTHVLARAGANPNTQFTVSAEALSALRELGYCHAC